MQSRGVFAALPLPPLDTVAALARWLRLDITELEWFADLKRLSARSPQPALRHYKAIVLGKPAGDIRLIEAPKVRLKHLQRQILTDILDLIPPHPAAHGFLKRRSILTYVEPHIGRAAVLRMDLRSFFPSIRARVCRPSSARLAIRSTSLRCLALSAPPQRHRTSGTAAASIAIPNSYEVFETFITAPISPRARPPRRPSRTSAAGGWTAASPDLLEPPARSTPAMPTTSPSPAIRHS